ncbi:hypothetical protein DIC66_08155 [Rhodoferax lacus]|uniref:Uncharacterized protein n=1 Tax=Rhodoferax lacus TaxID=2184758 RepID=A0A3E1RET6_9BURK|nr:hypothetical protein [Rhodoferax lacus]RFO97110.1 hypothetical protein DIC66_08155 [Rhodoferax lacus]
MTLKTSIAIGVAAFLSACGGGGGGTSNTASSTYLSGTAAGGAALVGNVIVTDSKGVSRSAPIAADGKYSIDVSGLTGPFVLKAAGTVGNTSVTYYSAATSADVGGTVNVTPFTDLIVSNIAAQMAVNYFSNPANVANIGSLITPANLAAAESAMQAKLQPVLTAMGLGASVDLLHQTFAADHSGLDAVLDMVKVSNTSGNIATLTNALTQVVIGTNNAAASTLDAAPVDTAAISGINPNAALNLQNVVTRLNALSALFATGLPSLTTLENSGIFDTSSAFIQDGQSFNQFATELSNNQNAKGMKFSNVNISLDATGTSGTIVAVLTSNSANFGGTITLKMRKDPTLGWLAAGNGRMAGTGMQARAQLDHWEVLASANRTAASGSNMLNGIHIYLDPFVYNSNHTSAMAVTAVLTGPGLPAGGILMAQDQKNTWFDVAAYGTTNGFDLIPECGTPTYSSAGTVIASGQCVDVSKALDNSVYTVVFQDSNGNALNGAGDELTLAKQPLNLANLNASMFPTIDTATIDGVPITPALLLPGKAVAISWSMPTGLVSNNMNLWSNNASGASYFKVQQNSLTGATRQTLLALGSVPANSGPATNVGIWLAGNDAYGRRYATSRSVSQ